MSLLQHYKTFVKQHPSLVLNLERLLHWVAWNPERFSGSEFAYEAFNAAVGLLGIYNESILTEHPDYNATVARYALWLAAVEQVRAHQRSCTANVRFHSQLKPSTQRESLPQASLATPIICQLQQTTQPLNSLLATGSVCQLFAPVRRCFGNVSMCHLMSLQVQTLVELRAIQLEQRGKMSRYGPLMVLESVK
eukprot:GHUV01031335.1.p1 GENE.GHUV01031335.1~~GHUV01031335.1.p1  ORF type:complete len:193 (+),score=27.23 GHUV01031335.1:193-771(+)